jgi:hypothetical protein
MPRGVNSQRPQRNATRLSHRKSLLSKDTNFLTIEIKGNTMRVANEVYHLGNISRVSTYVECVGFQGGPIKAVWGKRRRILFIGVALCILSILGKGGEAEHLANGILVFAALATIAQIIWMLRQRAKEYQLLIESSGIVRGLLASRDSTVIDRIITLITDAIREPPITTKAETFYNVHQDFSTTNQYGTGSIGRNTGKIDQQFNL